jgi:hypothetical protein
MQSFSLVLIAAVAAAKMQSEYVAPLMEETWYHQPSEDIKMIPKESLPKNWDWGNIEGINYLTNMRN